MRRRGILRSLFGSWGTPEYTGCVRRISEPEAEAAGGSRPFFLKGVCAMTHFNFSPFTSNVLAGLSSIALWELGKAACIWLSNHVEIVYRP